MNPPDGLFAEAFQTEQGVLAVEATGIARQLTVLTNDPVAGDDERDGIAGHSAAHSSDRGTV